MSKLTETIDILKGIQKIKLEVSSGQHDSHTLERLGYLVDLLDVNQVIRVCDDNVHGGAYDSPKPETNYAALAKTYDTACDDTDLT